MQRWSEVEKPPKLSEWIVRSDEQIAFGRRRLFHADSAICARCARAAYKDSDRWWTGCKRSGGAHADDNEQLAVSSLEKVAEFLWRTVLEVAAAK
jgi:hypothetical protein